MEAAGTLGTVARRITQSKTASANHIVATEIRKKGTQQDHCNAARGDRAHRPHCSMAFAPIPAVGLLYVRHDECADRAVITAEPEASACNC
jgi:hypothetical protein